MSSFRFLLPSRGNIFFRELAQAFCHELSGIGAQATVVHSADLVEPEDTVVMIAPQESVTLLGEQILMQLPSPSRLISITADQPGTPWFDRGLELAHHFAHRFDLSRWASIRSDAAGVETEFLPFGYHEPWDSFNPGAPRSSVVAFLGEATERRLEILANAESVIAGRSSRIVLSRNDVPNSIGRTGFMQGVERRRLLAGTTLQLGIHRSDTPYFEWLRMVESAHTGAVFVSEAAVHPEPFLPGIDFVISGAGGLPQAVRMLLDNPDRCREISHSARARLEEFPLRDAAETILRRSACPPRRTRPAPSVAPRGTTTTACETRSGSERLGRSLLSPGAQRRSSWDERGLRQRILRDLEKDVDRILRRDEFGQSPSSTPDVSIICPCRNGEELVERALESAACTEESVEIIFVDDASTDESHSVAMQWARRTPFLPIRIIQMAENVGLARARNVALRFSRAEFFLPLDHDNELLPDAIALLRARLVAEDDAAMSYGSLIRRTSERNVGLLSYFPWDAARFTQGNYIDALALIRRAAFDAVAVGYRSDGRLRGWEDFDVWLRFAEQGLRGSFIATPVGYYSVRQDQMSRGLPESEYFELLQDDFPRVFSGR